MCPPGGSAPSRPGFRIPPDPTSEEIRRRRLQRFANWTLGIQGAMELLGVVCPLYKGCMACRLLPREGFGAAAVTTRWIGLPIGTEEIGFGGDWFTSECIFQCSALCRKTESTVLCISGERFRFWIFLSLKSLKFWNCPFISSGHRLIPREISAAHLKCHLVRNRLEFLPAMHVQAYPGVPTSSISQTRLKSVLCWGFVFPAGWS